MTWPYIVICLIAYIIGYVITLYLLSKYGKSKFKIDYDGPKNYSNQDDWDSNAEAFAAWSFCWPFVYLVLLMYLLYKGTMKLSNYFNNRNKLKN